MDDPTKRTKKFVQRPQTLAKGKKALPKSKVERHDASQRALAVVLQATGLSELKPVKPSRKKKAA